MRRIEEPIGEMLALIGRVANVTHPLQAQARELLVSLHAERYLTPCSQCGRFPSEMDDSRQYLCRPCLTHRQSLPY